MGIQATLDAVLAAGERHGFEVFSDDLLAWAAFYGPPGGEATQLPEGGRPRLT